MCIKHFSLTSAVVMLLIPAWSFAVNDLPSTVKVDIGKTEEICSEATPQEWREVPVITAASLARDTYRRADTQPDEAREVA